MLNLKLDNLMRRKRAVLNLLSAHGPVEVELHRDTPLLPVVGSPHSGKTVLALLIAEQLLKQDYGVVWYSRHHRLFPGDKGYTENRASRLAVQLETHYPDSFLVSEVDQLASDEVLTCPNNSVLIIDEISLLEEDHTLAQRFVEWAERTGSLIILVAERPEAFYRIGLTDRDTGMVSLMLIGHLDAEDEESQRHSAVRQRLASHRFLSTDHTEFLAITPKPLWSDIIHVHLPSAQ